ncbi:MAG: ADP-ribosylglycohydrolase family protein [Deltaproteobacteria bacterium]|nr:ADP-ribosylglycohydrolase family protein [Deltaproteobacteria bacterium]
MTGFVELHDPRWPPRPILLGKRHPKGTFSDDTQMSLAVAEALLEAGHGDLETLMAAMARRFVAWSNASDNDRAPGGACLRGCEKLEEGAPWREAGDPHSKGCGSAMRVAPIGLFYAGDHAKLLEVARASSLPTHGHPAGIEAAAAAALLVALALEEASPEAMYRAVMDECAPRSADLRECFAKIPGLLDAPIELALSEKGLGEGWVGEEAVASALWCFWRSPKDFAKAVLAGANTDGDSDSIACIAGGISGAFHGVGAIPAQWQRELEDAERIDGIAQRLFAASTARSAEPA